MALAHPPNHPTGGETALCRGTTLASLAVRNLGAACPWSAATRAHHGAPLRRCENPMTTRDYGHDVETSDPAILALTSQRSRVVQLTMEALVPGCRNRERVHDLEAGIGEALDAIVDCSAADRALTENDIPFLRSVVRNALVRGRTEAEILHAQLSFVRVMWEVMVESVGGTVEGQCSIVRVTPTMLDYLDTAGRIGHDIHLTISEAQNSLTSVSRFELTGRLIDGLAPRIGTELNLARRCGLTDETAVLVVVARNCSVPASAMSLQMAMRVLRRATVKGGVEPLAVIRDDEIVLIRATRHDEAVRVAELLADVHEQLRNDGVLLSMATSTIYDDLSSVRAAYGEACLALETLHGGEGLLPLVTCSTLDYLMLRAGRATTWRLVPEAIRKFVTAELTGDRTLLDTLVAYVDNDLNVRRAARALFIHNNTAHYRLERIAERTGCNLRRFNDLEQLLIAIRLAEVSS